MSSYSIDGGVEEIYTATLSEMIQYQRPFFQSKQLTLASHTLAITILTQNASFFLDYISVTPNVTTSSSSSSTLVPSSTFTPSSSPVDSWKDKVPLGLIIGGALGGLALLIFAFIGFMFIWRKSKGHSYERNPTFTSNSSCEFHVSLQCIVWVLSNRLQIFPVWIRVPRANGSVTPFQSHLQHPPPDPGMHYSKSVYKRPLVPVSTPSSLGPLTSTSTHQVSTSATIPSDLPPRYDG